MEKKTLYKRLPKVDQVLDDERLGQALDSLPRDIIVGSIREELDQARQDISKEILREDNFEAWEETLIEAIIVRSEAKLANSLKKVVNGTGVVIHTNLGRSLINDEIIENIREVATNYSNLEFNLETGKRGSRYDHLEEVICQVVGGESAMVVNNNAAAVMLVLSSMAKNKEVIVSRGELIEIGGSFRIPDVMEESGARLVAVGTTNKTHIEDYEKNITEDTAALLKVHTSNYRILGFTSAVEGEDLVDLGSRYEIPVIEDLGSGVLIDLSKYGLEREPTVQDSLRAGIDLVTFSGDKLLGSAQAGIIVGKKKYIDLMKKNPLTRAFRVDKFTIAALETSFRYYLDEERLVEKIPTLSMLGEPLEKIEKRAEDLKALIDNFAIESITTSIGDDYSEVGGGSMPLEKIPSKTLVVKAHDLSIQEIENNLRLYECPIITRLYKDRIHIDLRTVRDFELEIISKGLAWSINRLKGVK